jgi:hypothetical protein
MVRGALLILVALLAGCAGLETQQASMPWEGGSERFQECVKYASVSHCRDEIYGHGS